jgi:hypothetical protein
VVVLVDGNDFAALLLPDADTCTLAHGGEVVQNRSAGVISQSAETDLESRSVSIESAGVISQSAETDLDSIVRRE